MSDVIEVNPVSSKRELNAFIRFPWQIYRGRNSRFPNWVPPLIIDEKTLLNPRKHPFQSKEMEHQISGMAVISLARRTPSSQPARPCTNEAGALGQRARSSRYEPPAPVSSLIAFPGKTMNDGYVMGNGRFPNALYSGG